MSKADEIFFKKQFDNSISTTMSSKDIRVAQLELAQTTALVIIRDCPSEIKTSLKTHFDKLKLQLKGL